MIAPSRRRRWRAPLTAAILSAATIGAGATPAAGPRPSPPAPRERLVSFWGSIAGAGGSDASVRQAGALTTGRASDFGPFLLLGGRVELYPSVGSSVSRHFGFGVELEGFAGEADVETQPGLPAEEIALTGGVVTPSFVARILRRSWEGYGGIGATLLWVTRVGGATGFSAGNDDTDAEAPLGLSLYAGVRRVYPGRWFFMVEARHRTGKNNFEHAAPPTKIDLDWRMAGIAIGTGYAF